MIFRLSGAEGAWQQIIRGYLPGLFLAGAFILKTATGRAGPALDASDQRFRTDAAHCNGHFWGRG
jgi:hypothetical protein